MPIPIYTLLLELNVLHVHASLSQKEHDEFVIGGVRACLSCLHEDGDFAEVSEFSRWLFL